MHCTRCGHENPEGSRFCAQCGSALSPERVGESTSVIPKVGGEDTSDQPEIAESTADAHAGAVESLPAGSALLVVKRGPNAGSRFLLDQDVTTAGRHPDSDIFLDDVTVSRRHVEFHREGGGFSVHDVGSLNGTYVNREPVDVATLAGGDEVQIGKFRLVYLTGRAPASRPLASAAVPERERALGDAADQRTPRLTIGEVLAVLRDDFPDVTISKIRYLESEDLVHPQRTPSGYRKFSGADVSRLRYVLAAQRDQYLPLRVIKEHLEALDRGEPLPPATGGAGRRRRRRPRRTTTRPAGAAADRRGVRPRGRAWSPSSWPTACSSACSPPTPTAGTRRRDLPIARAAAGLARHGIEPRHLRVYRSGVEREAGLVEQLVAPVLRARSEEARARADGEAPGARRAVGAAARGAAGGTTRGTSCAPDSGVP